MAGHVLGAQLTLVELAKRTGNGNLLKIVEALEETNEILQDAVWVPANDTTSHLVSRRLALPTGTWRSINKGVPSTASTTRQYREEIGLLEDYSKVDKQLVKLAANPRQFRSDEDIAHVEGLSQQLADAIVYGSRITEENSFNGLATRYATLGLTDGAGRTITVGAGGTGDDTMSLWIVQWGKGQVYMVYPKNSRTLGIEVEDLGEDTAVDSDGYEYQVYRTHFMMNGGLVVEDDRCIRRIANIETAGSSNIFDEDKLIEVLNSMKNRGKGSLIYCNRTGLNQFDINAKDKTNVQYDANSPWGYPIYRFRTHPIRLCDALLDTESAIS